MTSFPATASSENLLYILRALPGLHIFLTPKFSVLDASESYLAATHTTRDQLVGHYLLDVFPSNPQTGQENTTQKIRQSLEYVVQHQKPHTLDSIIRYDIKNSEGIYEERYWQMQSKPVFNQQDELIFLIHSVEEKTQTVKQEGDQEKTHSSLRAIVEASGGTSWDYDVKSRRFYWNPSFELIFGYPVSDAGEPPENWDARVHPDEYEKIKKSIDQAVQQKQKVWTGNYRFLKANGTFTHVVDHGFILYDDVGEPYRMLGSLVDLDLQQANERQAKENLERFELLAKATNDVIWDWDLVTDYIWWNEGFKTTFGYRQEAIEHDINSWYGRLHPEDAGRVVSGIHEVIDSGGTNWQDEYRFRKADGTYAEVFDRGLIAHDQAGKPLRMIGAMVDLTEKNNYARELQASEQHVRALLEGIPEIAWVAHSDGRVTYYNKAWYAYTGNSGPDEGWDHVVHPNDLASTIAHWTKALASGQEYINEARLKRASDGQYRWFTMRATPLHNAEGHIQAWIGVDTDIQEQKDIQQGLVDRDNYVQRMLAQAPVQFAVLKGTDWEVDFATPQMTVLLGREIAGKKYREVLPELEEQGLFEMMENVYSTGKLFRAHEMPIYINRKGTGELELGYYDFTYQPLFNAENQVEGVMILVVEVTEQVLAQKQTKQLTAELKASHDRITQILDALPHMTFTTQPDGYVDYYSQQWYVYLGIERHPEVQLEWQDYLHPDDQAKAIAKWRHSLDTGEVYVMENRWRHGETGQYRWFLVRGIPVKDTAGHITLWVGSQTDIHDQKETQLALQEGTQHFQFLADSMPQLVWTTDPNGYHDYFNQKWVEYTGYDLEASKGNEMWKNLLHPADQARAAMRWEKSLATGQPYQVEYRFKRAANGEWRWFLGRALPLIDHDGNIIRWFGTCTDIEEQKRDEEIMAQTNRELRSTNEDLDSFVYTASHDLKLPIINMAGIFQELTQNATFHDPDAELLISMFDKSLHQINTTISDLAEIVKVQKNIHAQREQIYLTELVDEVKLSIKDLIQSAQAKIHEDFTAVPTLEFSRVNLKSIFYNLISNAVKYRSPDRTPDIKITTARHQDYVVLTIQDNGMGMNLEKHGSKMFQMFKRFHNHVPGSGLGLYIVNRILQKNDGFIEVQSEENVGTTFTINFKNTN